MKKILLSALFLLAIFGEAYSYTFNFTDCTVTNRAFVWDNTNSYGECVDLTSVFDILDSLGTTTTDPSYPILSTVTSGSPSPKYDAGLYYDPVNNILTSTGGYETSPSASPGITLADSDSGNSPSYEIAQYSANYISGTTSPNANFYIKAMITGSEFTYVESDVANDQLKLNKKTLIASGITKSVTAKTSTPYTVASTDFGQILTNTGATALIQMNLPAITTSYIGQAITFVVTDTDGIRIEPNGSDWIMGPTNNPGDYLQCATQGCTMTLRAIALAQWVAEGYYGTWTEQ